MKFSGDDLREALAARTDEFKRGAITEPVYRALLFSHGVRGEDLEMEVRANRPAPPMPEWVSVVARAIATKAVQNKQMTLAEWERFVATLWKDNAGPHRG